MKRLIESSIHRKIEPLEFTGERMVPEAAFGEIYWEHVWRYRFARQFVRGLDVLDIACGEGYGTAALAKAGVRSIVGVDISEETVEHAVAKYRIDARVGSAEKIPLPSGSVDVVISFETIEHVPEPERFLAECWRVCRPGGRIVISTPNKSVYTDSLLEINPYHISEMEYGDFCKALGGKFHSIHTYTQRFRKVPWWHPRWMASDAPPPRPLQFLAPLREHLRKLHCPLEGRTAPVTHGDAVVPHILSEATFWESFFSEFAIHRRIPFFPEQPTYYMAAGTRR